LPALVETDPLPVTVIDSVPGAAAVNVAVTALVLVIVTVHVGAVPAHAPPQPLKVAPAAGVAVSVTEAPDGMFALQAAPPLPQLIPVPVTWPLPLTETESRNVEPPPPPPVVNVAVTDFAAFISTLQVVLVPVQDPPQPEKVAPAAVDAVSVTVEFAVWPAVHAVAPLPQLIPPPLTLPVPKTETVSVNPVPLTPPLKVAVTLFA
jgi:hypothetical protein